MKSKESSHVYYFCGSEIDGDSISMKRDWTSFDLAEVLVSKNRSEEILRFTELDDEPNELDIVLVGDKNIESNLSQLGNI